MFYYKTLVASQLFRGKEALTYSSDQLLDSGTLVEVPLRSATVSGVVLEAVDEPQFSTKQIAAVPPLPCLPKHLLTLAEWLAAYYASPLGLVTQQFLPKSLSHKQPYQAISQRGLPNFSLPDLTQEQQATLQKITEKPDTYLLHGETGTGKTRVYIELAKEAFKKNQSSIVLTPEIGLTPQIAETFVNTFGAENVIITHSQLTESVRRKLWLRILATDTPLIVIGPRSALFSPLKRVGLIIVDEAHEPSYRQEQSPHYHATKVASKLAELQNATLVLGSATPSLGDYFLAQEKKKPILRMQSPARTVGNFAPAEISVVDLKDRTQFTRKAHISNMLIDAVKEAMANGEQSLLFLNRRGTARIILCDRCGWQALCPHCNLPLAYHADNFTLRCHTCGFFQAAITSCPVCQNSDIALKSVGTKAIVEEISAVFPEAKVQRFDTDNLKNDRFEHHYESIRSGKVDILVGTQLLVKGLDLPKLSVVGVIIADTSLYIPDYSAQERTYQLLKQVIGRVGRGHRESKVIIQTYEPHNPILQAATKNSWSAFYERELAERQKFLFPPFCYLLRLTCRRATVKSAEATAVKLAKELHQHSLKIIVDGPSPSFQEKIAGKFQWQLIVKAKDRGELLKVVELLPSGWSYDLDPLNLL